MTRLWLWSSLSKSHLETVLCRRPETYGFKYISSLSSVIFNSHTVYSQEKNKYRLLHNKHKNVDSCVAISRMSSFLTNLGSRMFDIHSYGKLCRSMIPSNSTQGGSAGHHHMLLLTCTNQVNQRREYKNKKPSSEESSSSDEESEGSDAEDEVSDFPPGYKDRKAFVKSLRADAIVSTGLGLSRNTVDDIFFKSCLKLNGAKLLKKSKVIEESDYVDVIVERNEDKLRIKRVKLLKVLPERTQKERIAVKLRVWKATFEVVDEDKKQW
ncbi:uncharacterized protein LOC121370697 [Gigantopelta aegis]|uniref:uncharacterized protein LOC121370697 n=1 Tax=Gigantopelta aegis TaxID=1735272 RepID=UPI001B88A7AF|nr:uncharacterized protein LOC121370697 [Gigantopelta aegis]